MRGPQCAGGAVGSVQLRAKSEGAKSGKVELQSWGCELLAGELSCLGGERALGADAGGEGDGAGGGAVADGGTVGFVVGAADGDIERVGVDPGGTGGNDVLRNRAVRRRGLRGDFGEELDLVARGRDGVAGGRGRRFYDESAGEGAGGRGYSAAGESCSCERKWQKGSHRETLVAGRGQRQEGLVGGDELGLNENEYYFRKLASRLAVT